MALPPLDPRRLRTLTSAMARDVSPAEQIRLILAEITHVAGAREAYALITPARIARALELGVPKPVEEALLRHKGSASPVLLDGGAALVLPLPPEGGVWVGQPSRELAREPDRLTALQALADLVAVALLTARRLDESLQRARALEAARTRMAEQYQLMQELAVVDELTGAHNRRFFQQRLDEEVRRLQRYGRPLALMIFDVDKFKTINDTRGHAAGDLVLVHVASCAKRAARKVDVVARWGGDEFVILLPETDGPGGVVVAERVRSLAAEPPEHVDVAITLSVGVAAAPPRWKGDGAALMKGADDALYRSKQAGRDRVSVVTLGG
jgi:diguanylate cyclase (GGDEF)-like protein